jgi:hypothetical protein
MSGLDSEQLDELVWLVEEQLEEPWHKTIGRPKDLSLREAIVVACGYMRQNITQEVWAEIFDTSQPVISGIITKFTPLIEASTEEDRPTVDEAKEAAGSRADGAGRRLPGTHLVLARYTRTMVGKT